MRAFALLGLLHTAPVQGQPASVISPRPEKVEVTIYRDQNRGNEPLRRNWLNGFALISETRTISIPAGGSEVRFEGVASGIVPQSAIVTGVPDGLIERNRDALLLSAGSLVDRSLGQRVTLRRTDVATGEIATLDAIVRTGSQGGVVIQTPEGFEALRCSGLAETLTYPEVPVGLSPKPTLSVRVRARQALTAAVTLSYLASGFDWQADYVGLLSPDERTLQLQAWLTLASTDDTSFVTARTSAVAGRLNRENVRVPPAEAPPIRLRCWPRGTTSDIPATTTGDLNDFSMARRGGPPPPPAPPPPPPPAPSMEIMVTGARVTAQREALGDLQLYRLPEPVTVAANAQKQVGLLDQPAVRVEPVYRLSFDTRAGSGEAVAELLLRSRNRQSDGLGLPLPAGNLVVFRAGGERPLLIGEAPVRDHAIGEKVEFRLGSAAGVRGTLASTDDKRRTLVVSNDRSVPVRVEVELANDNNAALRTSKRLVRRDGVSWWEVTVPANGRATLGWRLRD